MKLHIQTQVEENYGNRWKCKGGDDYMIMLDDVKCTEFFDKKCSMIVDQARNQIEKNSDYYREYILSWNLVEDDFLTDFERSQLAYDGVIAYPAHQLDLSVA